MRIGVAILPAARGALAPRPSLPAVLNLVVKELGQVVNGLLGFKR